MNICKDIKIQMNKNYQQNNKKKFFIFLSSIPKINLLYLSINLKIINNNNLPVN